MKRLILILLFSTQTVFSFASCLACWSLTPVSIILSDSTKFDGYVMWNEEWPAKPSGIFKKDFFSFHKAPYDTISFFKSVVFLDSLFPFKRPFVIEDQFLKFHVDKLKSISLRTDTLKDIASAGELTVLPHKTYSFLLKNRPFATYATDGITGGLIYFSFNKSIDKNKLIELNKTLTYQDIEKLEGQGVYVFVEQWD